MATSSAAADTGPTLHQSTIAGDTVRRVLVLLAIASTVMSITVPASAATRTDTNGRLTSSNFDDGVCRRDCPMSVPGQYRFKGHTDPSREGHKVVFHYRRPGRQWHRFETAPDGALGGGDRFVVTGGRERPVDRVDAAGRWRIPFTVWDVYSHENWELRARFIRQDGFAPSKVIIPVFIEDFGD